MNKNNGKPQEICGRTFRFSIRVVRLCQCLDEKPGVSRTLSRQLLRPGTAIGANVEEAQAGQSKADFISKNSIALKEARETVYWLRLLGASNVVSEKNISELLAEANEIARVIGAIVVSSKRNSAGTIMAILFFPFSLLIFNCIGRS